MLCRVEVTFGDDDLEQLATRGKSRKKLPQSVVTAYQKCLFILVNVSDERELFSGYRSHRFEKLKGQRQHQHSMRLNDQYRLILELSSERTEKQVRIVEIIDYH